MICSAGIVLFIKPKNHFTNLNLKLVTFLYIGLLILISSYSILSRKFIENSFETTSIRKIVEHQSKHGGLYSSGIHPTSAIFKSELYKFHKPKVLLVGSSRVLQFRQYMFNSSFINAGKLIANLGDMELLKELLKVHTPEVVILGVDFWWFARKRTAKKDVLTSHQYNNSKIKGYQKSKRYGFISSAPLFRC